MDQEYQALLSEASSSRDLKEGELNFIDRTGEQLKTLVEELKNSLEESLPRNPEEVRQDQRIRAQSAVATSIMVAALTIGGLQQQFQAISGAAGRIVRRLVNWFLNQVLGLLTAYWQHLTIDSWSVGASSGFPSGISATITVTFK